jgi:TIR domain/Pentapeptide repeats (8 copies)
MAKREHLKILKQGTQIWNRWREQNPTVGPDLSYTDLSGKNLRGSNLSKANLQNANLNSAQVDDANLAMADLSHATLIGTNLPNVNLQIANLISAVISECSLVKADLRHADLSKTRFTGSDLSSAELGGCQAFSTILRRCTLSCTDFGYAILYEATFADVDLTDTIGLETISHLAPSTIGIDTLFRSKGKIPEVFLRGCGVPEDFITYARSLVTNPIEYYSCFISHSSSDKDFVERLYADLQAKNIRCWYAPEDLKIGERFRIKIEESIRIYDKVMIVLSKNSIRSAWVEEEVEAALERERQQKGPHVLFPIRLDDAVMETTQAWAASLRRTRHIGDFSKWKNHDSYQKAFDRLLRDLKSEAKAAPASK